MYIYKEEQIFQFQDNLILYIIVEIVFIKWIYNILTHKI